MGSRRHVLLISTSFPDVAYQAGQEAAGAFVSDFCMALGDLVKVTAVVPTIRSTEYEDLSENVNIFRFHVPSLPLSLLNPIKPSHWSDILQTFRAGQAATQQMIRQNKIDHVLALWALPSGYWAKKTGLPYTVWALGSDIWMLGKVPLVRAQLRSVLQTAAHRFADGVKLAKDVHRICGKDCQFLPSSRQLHLSQTKQPATVPPYKLAFLGRWHVHKGIDLLLESLRLLSNDDWSCIKEVRIFGGGPLEMLVKSEARKLEQSGRPITVGGYLNRIEAIALYEWADYLLLPSRIESIPVLFSDALQTCCPLVAMPVGDLPYLIQEYKVGVIARGVTGNAFANALRKMLHEYNPEMFMDSIMKIKDRFDVQVVAREFARKISL